MSTPPSPTSPRRRRARHALFAVALGAFLAGSVVQRPLPALAFAFPLPMLALLSQPSARPFRRSFVLGWLAGFGCNATAFYWIPGLLYDFAGFPYVAGVPVALLFAATQGLTLGFGALFAEVAAHRGLPRWVAFPAALTLVFSLSPALFPWRVGTGAVGWLAWAQIGDLGGPPLLDVAMLLIGSAAWELMRPGDGARDGGARDGGAHDGGARDDVARNAPDAPPRKRWLVPRRQLVPLFAGALALGAPALYGQARLHQIEAEREAAPRLAVGVVQPNIGIFDKHDPLQHDAHLHLLRDMTRGLEQEGAELVVWPESAYPFAVHRGLLGEADDGQAITPGGRRRRSPLAGPRGVLYDGVRGPILFGAITTGEDRCDRWNSAIALDERGVITGISDKVELLAFGETVPLWHWLPPLQSRFPCPGIRPGLAPETLEIAGARVAVLNCYEDVLAAHARTVAHQRPDFLVNVTNDAWFGDTREPHLHQLVARQRSIETRRDLVRAVNTGVSSHIAATGATLHETETYVRTAFVADVARLDVETFWVRHGDWLTPGLYALLLALAFRRRGRAHATGR
ncbi:MAG: apolipoprotein N-acyltransferase [Myxococcales bacterium]|nr:apolipoprotein N-acyltransferase [Myxococcales bacterium]